MRQRQTIAIATSDTKAPPELLAAFERAEDTGRFHYTSPKFLYYVVWLWGTSLCGVFGDGPNASYEWFRWTDGKLETSDCGYGCPAVALRDVLIKAEL